MAKSYFNSFRLPTVKKIVFEYILITATGGIVRTFGERKTTIKANPNARFIEEAVVQLHSKFCEFVRKRYAKKEWQFARITNMQIDLGRCLLVNNAPYFFYYETADQKTAGSLPFDIPKLTETNTQFMFKLNL